MINSLSVASNGIIAPISSLNVAASGFIYDQQVVIEKKRKSGGIDYNEELFEHAAKENEEILLLLSATLPLLGRK